MGADDEGNNKPHPATKNPATMAPCDDDDGLTRWPAVPTRGPRLPVATTRPPQVTDSAGYRIAGKVLLAAAGALAGVLLALVAMYLYNSARRRRLGLGSGGGRRRLDRSPAIAGTGDDDDGAAPRGLDPAVLRALPVVAVAAPAGDCAVCLAELRPGDKARALPRCAHLFHADCIDAWFRGNTTCPLCRADVVVVALAPGADEDPEATAPPEVRVHVVVDDDDHAAASKASMAMGRLPSGTDLDKTRRAFFATARSVSI